MWVSTSCLIIVWWSSPFLGLSEKNWLCVQYIWLCAFLQRPPLPSSPIYHLWTFCHVQRKWKHLLGNEFWFQTLLTAGRKAFEKPCDILLLSFIPMAGYPEEKHSAQLGFLPWHPSRLLLLETLVCSTDMDTSGVRLDSAKYLHCIRVICMDLPHSVVFPWPAGPVS